MKTKLLKLPVRDGWKSFKAKRVLSNLIHSATPTYFFIHGWLSTLASTAFVPTINHVVSSRMGNAIGIRNNDNSFSNRMSIYFDGVVGVQWTKLAKNFYSRAAEVLKSVAKHVANLIKLLKIIKNVEPHHIILVGHSMGAHLSGFIGKLIHGIGRIEGIPLTKNYLFNK